MKKYLSVFIFIGALMGLTSCGTTTSEAGSNIPEATAAVTTTAYTTEDVTVEETTTMISTAVTTTAPVTSSTVTTTATKNFTGGSGGYNTYYEASFNNFTLMQLTTADGSYLLDTAGKRYFYVGDDSPFVTDDISETFIDMDLKYTGTIGSQFNGTYYSQST